MKMRNAKFAIGDVVRHRVFPFRGVVFDVDPEFANTEEWWNAIPAEIRPSRDQPFYHLFAENEDSEYVAYVSEQNLVADDSGQPIRHPQVRALMNMTVSLDAKNPANGRVFRIPRGRRSYWLLAAFWASSSFLRASSAFFCISSCSRRWRSSSLDCSIGSPS